MSETLRYLLPSVRMTDPHLCTDSHALLCLRRLLFQGLVVRNGIEFSGVLAGSWEAADRGRVWTFRLKEGTRFSDGREVRAEDAAFSLLRAASADREGQLYTVTHHAYIGSARIEAAGPRTVRLSNPEPIADLPEFLADLSILPAGWKDYNDGTGTGTHTVEGMEDGYALLRPRFKGQPFLEFREEKDPEARAAAVAEGQADFALDPPLLAVRDAGKDRRFSIFSWSTSLCVVFLIRCDRPPLDDPRARLAFNLGLDKERLIREILHGLGRPLNGPLSDRHFGRDPSVPPHPYDPGRALRLLREAGLEEGFPLDVHAPCRIPDEGPRLAEFVAEGLRELGIDARPVLHEDRTEYARKIAAGELDGLFCFDSSPPGTYKVLREKLDSRTRGPWWQGYHNDEFDALLSKAAETEDRSARQKIYFKAYGILHREAPWIFLYQPDRFWIGNKRNTPPAGFDSLGYPSFPTP